MEYVKRICSKCLFYEEFNDMKCSMHCCTFLGNFNPMTYVSAYDYEHYPDRRDKYDEPCSHYVNLQDLKDKYRKEKNRIEKNGEE